MQRGGDICTLEPIETADGGRVPVVAVVIERPEVRDRIAGRLRARRSSTPSSSRARRPLLAYARACALSAAGMRLDAIVCDGDADVVQVIGDLASCVPVLVLRPR